VPIALSFIMGISAYFIGKRDRETGKNYFDVLA
jgi:hypothetical protein